MIYQKQGRRLRGMIDRSHQPTSEVALYNKLNFWVLDPLNKKKSVFTGKPCKFHLGQSRRKGNTFPIIAKK
jgi:hypothetical protein